MNKKLTVALVVGAAAVTAGYVFRKPLADKVEQLTQRLEEWAEGYDQARFFKLSQKYGEDYLWKDDASSRPDAG